MIEMDSPIDDRFKLLVNDLLNQQLAHPDSAELQTLLLSSKKHRAYYREQAALQSQLFWLFKDSSEEEFHSRKTQKTFALPTLSTIAALIVLAAIFLIQKPPFNPTPSQSPPVIATQTILTQASQPKWHPDSPQPIQGQELNPQTYHLKEGFLRLDIGQGSQVFIEGPCKFEPVHQMLLKIHEGRVSAEVDERGHGFTIWTPAGKFVDLGTRFGIGVGTDESGNDVILSEVFAGEIKVEPRDHQPSENRTITEGQTLGLLGRLSHVDLSETVDQRPIKLNFNRYEQTASINRYRSQDVHNLALGKPVSSTSTYLGANGEIFPAENLTDGRINDTGFPGNWSFWLASNESPIGEIIIDLESPQLIDCLQLLNTQNRHHRDRGTKEFSFFTSNNGQEYQRITSGKLGKIQHKLTADSSPPAETFNFQAHLARYLKLQIHTFYRAETSSTSAGLNEIRIFGPNTPSSIKEQLLSSTPTPDTPAP